jgi:hypothetical protein
MIDDHEIIYFCFFHSIFKITCYFALQQVLASAIEKKIALAGDVCFRPPITIKSHDLHVGDIRRDVGEITSYHEKDYLFSFFFVHGGCASFGLSLAFPFCLPYDGSCHPSFIGFL